MFSDLSEDELHQVADYLTRRDALSLVLVSSRVDLQPYIYRRGGREFDDGLRAALGLEFRAYRDFAFGVFGRVEPAIEDRFCFGESRNDRAKALGTLGNMFPGLPAEVRTEERQAALTCAVNARNACEETPLHVAVCFSDVSAVRGLIAAGAEVDALDKWRRSPLYRAVHHDYHHQLANGTSETQVRGFRAQAAEALLSGGANPNQQGQYDLSLFWDLIEGIHSNPAMVDAFLKRGAIPGTKFGRTPLQESAEKGYTDTVRVLLRRGANPDERGSRRDTALHFAVARGDLVTMKLLLERGANRNLKNRNKQTPLDFAKSLGKTDCVNLLEAPPFALAPWPKTGQTQQPVKRTRPGIDVPHQSQSPQTQQAPQSAPYQQPQVAVAQQLQWPQTQQTTTPVGYAQSPLAVPQQLQWQQAGQSMMFMGLPVFAYPQPPVVQPSASAFPSVGQLQGSPTQNGFTVPRVLSLAQDFRDFYAHKDGTGRLTPTSERMADVLDNADRLAASSSGSTALQFAPGTMDQPQPRMPRAARSLSR